MPNDNTSTMRYAGLATQWLAMLLLGVWVGHKLDGWLGWRVPVFLIVLPMVALVVSLYGIIKEFNKKKQ